MFRIGIIGSDNSHAETFSKLLNLPDKNGEYPFPDCKVVGIFGLVKERTEEVAKKGNIPYIAEKPEDLMGKVDAVMVVFRHGDLHIKYAMPFIEAGIPTWIDKPFTIKNEDARKIIEAAKKYNTLVTGGSTCKYAYDVLTAKNEAEGDSRIGAIKTGAANFPATLTNEYGGIYFYGSHLIEMTMAIFGYDVKSVIAAETNEVVTAVVKYDNLQVTMNFIPGNHEYYVTLFGERGTIVREIDIGKCFLQGFGEFANMLRTKKLPMPLEKFYSSVELLNAVVESYQTKQEVTLKGY